MACQRPNLPQPKLPAEQFYDAALRANPPVHPGAGRAGLVVCLLAFRVGRGSWASLGAVISYVNHVWLERVIDALGERITSGQSRAGRM